MLVNITLLVLMDLSPSSYLYVDYKFLSYDNSYWE